MKILLLSDTHIGITERKSIDTMFCNISNNEKGIDLIVYTGDYSGGVYGHSAVERTIKLLTKYLPSTQIITTIGNHDYWCSTQTLRFNGDFPTQAKYRNNYRKIVECFNSYNVHFLDEDGIFQLNDVVFMGASGWYSNPCPPTNDKNFLPAGINGTGINSYILNKCEAALDAQSKALDEIYTADMKVVFVSHFATIPDLNDYKGAFETFGWSENISKVMKSKYNCKHFLQGHSHHRKNGPESFEAGSDYYNPKYLIIDI